MRTVALSQYFENIRNIPESLYIIGSLPPPEYKRITVVGSRKPSSYGKAVVRQLIEGLRGYPLSIISGLALGIDADAHRAALEAHLHTMALPGSGLSQQTLYPRTHVGLAKQIIEAGGALLSPWEAQHAAPWTFPVRNRIMAGLANLVLVIESTEDSGTMITARAATSLGITLAAVPGNIDNTLSSGPNALIAGGAHCVRNAQDLLTLLGISVRSASISIREETYDDHPILKHLTEPLSRDELARRAGLSAALLNAEITMLELDGLLITDTRGMLRRSHQHLP